MSELAQQLIAENKAKHARGEDASYLDLGKCGLTEMPDIADMEWLEVLVLGNLWIDWNRLKWIQSKNQGVNNYFHCISEQVMPRNLRILFMAGDFQKGGGITDGGFLKNMNKLVHLDLRNNKITNGDFLKRMNHLKYLDLSNNKITNGDFLTGINQLISLNLQNNKISNTDFLKDMSQLRSLNLSNNQISSITPLFHLLRKGLPITLEEFKFRDQINLQGTPFAAYLPIELMEQGNEAIIRYFSELDQTQQEDITPLNEAKLIIIGQPRAGKTTLRKKLHSTEEEMPAVDLTTRGIDVDLATFPYKDSSGKTQEFCYHIWDFGGQQIYHATHRFFLTKRTLYLAVVDTDVNDKQNDLDYWLHMVELLGDGSPVLLVQNQKNNRSIEIADTLRNRFRKIIRGQDYELNFAQLKQKDNPKFSAPGLENFQRFKADIEHWFQQQTPVLMPPAKSKVREALETLAETKPVLELSAYYQHCEEQGLTDPLAQTDLLRTLHNLGSCLWYENYDFLDRIIILRNQWATDAVFKVLDNEVVKKNKGRFQRSELSDIWSATEYKGRHAELIELMKRFKLCYQIGQSDEYIAPQLLDKNPPKGFSRASVQEGAVRLVVAYEFMPRGIITQFIVAMHRQISGGQQHAWETGFAVEQQVPIAVGMAEESYDSRKLELWAKGNGAGSLLQHLLRALEEIHASFNRLQYQILLPCVCSHCSQPDARRIKEFEYEEILLELYQNRQQGIRCSYGNETVPFDKLLGVLGFTTQQTRYDFERKESIRHYYDKGDGAPPSVVINNHISTPNPPSMSSQEPKHEQSNNSIYGVAIAFMIMFPTIAYAVSQLSVGKAILTITAALFFLMLALVFAGTQNQTLSEDTFVKISERILKKIPGLGSLVNMIKGE